MPQSRPTLTKRRRLGGELTTEQWDIIHDALEMYADSMDATIQDQDEPVEIERLSTHQAEVRELTAKLSSLGLDGRSLII